LQELSNPSFNRDHGVVLDWFNAIRRHAVVTTHHSQRADWSAVGGARPSPIE
jgi:hypothetical protein